MYFFSALQRQLGYPEVPRLRRPDELEARVLLLEQKIAQLENRLKAAESELSQDVDLSARSWSSPKIPRACRLAGGRRRADSGQLAVVPVGSGQWAVGSRSGMISDQ